MPGTTQYLDTPVVPTSAFAGAGYNNVDCAYPAATPAVSTVTRRRWRRSVGVAAGNTLTITALGDQQVANQRLLGSGGDHRRPTTRRRSPVITASAATQGTVTIGGVPAT